MSETKIEYKTGFRNSIHECPNDAHIYWKKYDEPGRTLNTWFKYVTVKINPDAKKLENF